MSPRRAAWLLAAGRAALGLAVLAAPEQVMSHWPPVHELLSQTLPQQPQFAES